MPRKRQRASKRQITPKAKNRLPGLAFFFVIDFLIVITVYLALVNINQEMIRAQTISTSVSTVSVVPTTTVSSSGYALGSQALNITLKITNDEIVGRYGYWALANYTRTVKAYPMLNPNSSNSNSAYFLMVDLNGTWRTFAGALSPDNGTLEPLNGSGAFYVKYDAIENYTLNKSAQLNGYVGEFNLNGTIKDILKGRYANQTGISPSTFHWTVRYFNFSGSVNTTKSYVSAFTFGTQTYGITINQTGTQTTGDIVT